MKNLEIINKIMNRDYYHIINKIFLEPSLETLNKLNKKNINEVCILDKIQLDIKNYTEILYNNLNTPLLFIIKNFTTKIYKTIINNKIYKKINYIKIIEIIKFIINLFLKNGKEINNNEINFKCKKKTKITKFLISKLNKVIKNFN